MRAETNLIKNGWKLARVVVTTRREITLEQLRQTQCATWLLLPGGYESAIYVKPFDTAR